MLTLKKRISDCIADAVASLFGADLLSAADILPMLEYPPDQTLGDIALPCFRLAKTLRRSPMAIADALAAKVSCPDISEVSSVSGYLNFRIAAGAFTTRVLADVFAGGDRYGSPMDGEGRIVV